MYLCFTVLYEYIQGLCLAVLGSDPQRRHTVAVSGRHFGPVTKQQHQNSGTPLLLVRRFGCLTGRRFRLVAGVRAFAAHLRSFVGSRPFRETHLLHEGPAHNKAQNHVVGSLSHCYEAHKNTRWHKKAVRQLGFLLNVSLNVHNCSNSEV